MRARTRLIPVVAITAALLAMMTPASADETTTVQGTYVSFGAGALLYGGFSGASLASADASLDDDGNLSGTFEETLVNHWQGPGSVFGTLHYTGTFEINTTTGAFLAEGVIDGGTCGFAGSSGTIVFQGNAVTGTYTAAWTHGPIMALQVQAGQCLP